jgi:hypothetical protein
MMTEQGTAALGRPSLIVRALCLALIYSPYRAAWRVGLVGASTPGRSSAGASSLIGGGAFPRPSTERRADRGAQLPVAVIVVGGEKRMAATIARMCALWSARDSS